MKSEDDLQMSEGRVWVFLTFTEAQMFLSKTKRGSSKFRPQKRPTFACLT